jgi:predicted ATP-grasp superfamily ATP-dependent carboligase
MMTETARVAAPRSAAETTGALVIGGNYGGLGIVRSLGRHGIRVWVLRDEHASAAASRYAERQFSWTGGDESSQVAFLLGLCREHSLDGWTVFPTTDESAAMLSRNEDHLGKHYLLTTPSWDVMRWAYDKRLTYELARDLEIAIPRTHYPRTREEVGALNCSYPVVLKPAVKYQVNSFTAARAWPVHTREELLAHYDEARELVEPDIIMVQELVPGGGETQFSFVALCASGHPLAYGTARRARQYPVEFGHGSTYVEMVEQPEIEEPSRRILDRLRYTGLVELEFKRDPVTGQFKLLDLNARAWAWHSLGRRAGVDFPYLCWQMCHDEPVAESRASLGARWIRMATDVPAAITEIRGRRLSRGSYLSSLRPPLEFAVFAADDPVPALAEMSSMLRRIWKRRSSVRR